MSYCRFSTDDWRSDVYVYEDAHGGITIHVAGNRVRGWIPRTFHIPLQWVIDSHLSKFKDARYRFAVRLYVLSYRVQSWYLSRAPRKFYTDRPHCGESFYGLNHDAAIERLMELEEYGYRVPESVIPALIDEERELLSEKS